MGLQDLFKPRKIAIDLKDKDGKRVVWYEESYKAHVYSKHVDTKTAQNIIFLAIKSPQLIFHDKGKNCKHYFYKSRTNAQGIEMYIKVIVDYRKKPAFIRTAYFTSNLGDATICY